MRVNRHLIACVAVGLLALSGAPASASLLTFDFAGTVTQNSIGALFPGKAVGDSFSGSFTVDTDAALTSGSLNTTADYDPTTFALTFEGTSYTVSNFTVWANSFGGIEFDFDDGVNSGFLSLRSTSGVYSSATVPTSFALSDFDDIRSVYLIPSLGFAQDEARLTSITPAAASAVPEPSTLLLLGLGFGLAGIRFGNRRL